MDVTSKKHELFIKVNSDSQSKTSCNTKKEVCVALPGMVSISLLTAGSPFSCM